MKLLTKLLLIADANGKPLNVKGKTIILALNGERTETKLQDVFSDLEFDMGEIYGNSLLSLYQVKEDGSLEVEGSKVQFMDAHTGEFILVKGIDKPFIKDDTTISFEDVKKFSEYFKISHPEEVFSLLSPEEKQLFISAREAKQKENEIAAKAASDAAEEATAAAKAQMEREQKEQREKEEAAYKATIDPLYVLEQNGYESLKTYYAGLEGFKHYVRAPHELFYGDDPTYPVGVVIKRGGTWWEEVKDEDIAIIDKNDREVVIEFPDKGIPTRLTINRETGQIEINIPQATE